MKGGVGCGHANNETVSASAIVVTNALGDVRDANGAIIAGARTANGAFADGEKVLRTSSPNVAARGNTTIALVAVSASLTKVQLAQIAAATSAAFFRRITPCGTSFDGDVIFAACPPTGSDAPMPVVEALAVAAMERAIERSVRAARGRDGIPGLGDANAAG